VIFATVGSHPAYGFDRFLRALESVPGELVVQHGPGEPPPNAARAVAWMSFPEIVEQMERAEHVVSHAGAGTILCAARAGHVPIVFPRLERYGETVDDHQLELARRLAADGTVAIAESESQLLAALGSTPPRGAEAALLAGADLVAAVRGELAAARRGPQARSRR
jgi:UDP-N-acetylglucosamine transferase subunit ALG13